MLPAITKSVERKFARLNRLYIILGGTAFLGLVLLTVLGVFWRYVLKAPIFGLEDISAMLFSVGVASAIFVAAWHQAHVSVNLIGKALGRFGPALARLLGAAVAGFVSYALYKSGSCGFACGDFTNNLSISHTPFYNFLSLSMMLYSLLLLLRFVSGFLPDSGVAPREPES